MNLLFIVSLLISFVFLTYEYYYLAIPARLSIRPHGDEVFQSFGFLHYSREDLKRSVKKRFPFIPSKYLLIHVTSLRCGIMCNVSASNKNFIRLNSNVNYGFITLKNTDDLIRVVTIKNKIMYKSNDCVFDSYQKASENLDEVKKYDKLKSQYKLIGKDEYGRETWRSVWKNCFYKCFSKNNFYELILTFLVELNKYRLSFLENPVKLSATLQYSAFNVAKQIAQEKFELMSKFKSSSSNEIVSFISAPFANIQLNKWYEEYLLFRRKLNSNKEKTRNLIGLFSLHTTKVGFGISKIGKYIIIVFSLLISFVLQTYEYYYLAIPARLLTHLNGTRHYFGLDGIYRSGESLKRNLLRQFSTTPPDFLLLQLLSTHHGFILNATQHNNRFLKVNSDNGNFEDINVENRDELIITSGSGRQLMFVANDGYYDSYLLACEYLDNVKKYDKVKSQYKLVGKDEYGRETWRRVWSNCHFKCFSAMNFFELILRWLKELNFYRRYFSLLPVELSNYLHHYACFAASSIAGSNLRLLHRAASVFSKEIVTKASAPFASLKMNQLYELFLSLKRRRHINKESKKIVTVLFSRKTTRVGFGNIV
uniref:SCP domain-containing protein n=1 Tax=Strongyloides stercoralis TaxID=6248 RepID=A0AAF5DPB8_STRER